MLFNSPVFVFVFLPIVFAGFFLIGSRNRILAVGWLIAASLFFYGWWNPRYVALLGVSVAFNYAVGMALVRHAGSAAARRLLFLGVGSNLALLAYYKYTNFFVSTFWPSAGPTWATEIALPLGISFFTFTQTAFLVDAYRGQARPYGLLDYALFVTYFPHLIAGPIFHHREIIPQFHKTGTYRPQYSNVAVGLTIFVFGLFKKVVLADGVAPYASLVFGAADHGRDVTFFEAWLGALAYALQIYFDFSGYSDMAIGLSQLFGVRLPLNFYSPYKAQNIIEFWRRWHMSLSRFLRDYLYIPLGGNRCSASRRYLNLMITMLLGGLWHGAGWTFVIWGGLHGLYLCMNYLWRAVHVRILPQQAPSSRLRRVAATFITFIAVVVAWVFFRAENLAAALNMIKGMLGMNGATAGFAVPTASDVARVTILLAAVWLLPNTQQIMRAFRPAIPIYGKTGFDVSRRCIKWEPTLVWMSAFNGAALLSIWMMLSQRESPFLYFNF